VNHAAQERLKYGHAREKNRRQRGVGHDIYIDERTVDAHVGRLRKAINRGYAAVGLRAG